MVDVMTPWVSVKQAGMGMVSSWSLDFDLSFLEEDSGGVVVEVDMEGSVWFPVLNLRIGLNCCLVIRISLGLTIFEILRILGVGFIESERVRCIYHPTIRCALWRNLRPMLTEDYHVDSLSWYVGTRYLYTLHVSSSKCIFLPINSSFRHCGVVCGTSVDSRDEFASDSFQRPTSIPRCRLLGNTVLPR